MPPITLQVRKIILPVLLVKRENTDDSHNNTRTQRNGSHVGKQDVSHTQLLKSFSFFNTFFSIDIKRLDIRDAELLLMDYLQIYM